MSAIPAPASRYVGTVVPRKEDMRLLTGHGQYVADVSLPGTLHAAFVRSDLAKARIVSIETAEARALPGVVAVFTANDFDGRFGEAWHPVLGEMLPVPAPLAVTDVRYVGDPIALVIAEDRYIAEDACDLVDVRLESAEPVVDFLAAVRDTKRIVHEASGETSNIMREDAFTSQQPDLDSAFSNGDHVVEVDIVSNRYVALPMETRGVLAAWSPGRDEMDITCSCQKVHQAREFFARFLRVPETKVKVSARDVGGGFGQKSFMFREECAVVLAARLLRRPIKWIEDRRENLVSAAHSRREFGKVRLAVDRNQVIQAMSIDHVADVGAYPVCPAVMLAPLLPGPYKVPRLSYKSKLVWTNTMGIGAYRGPWLFETTAREMAIDHTARLLGFDPMEFRLRNLLTSDDLPFTSPGAQQFKDITPKASLELALEMLDYGAFRTEQALARFEGRLIGVGCCVYVEPTSMLVPSQTTEAALVKVDAGGNVVAYLGTTAQGQGVETTMAQVIADALGVAYDDVTVIQGQTDGTPYGRGTGGSGTAVMAGTAARQAASIVHEKVLAIAAHVLEASQNDIVIEHGQIFVQGAPSKAITMKDIASAAYRMPHDLPDGASTGLEGFARFRPEVFPTWSNAAHLCVIEVDTRTCMTKILRYIVAEDCGRMINPQIVDGQISGGVVQGLGGVLLEDFVYDVDGNPLTTSLMDYLVPTTADVPDIEIRHIETPSSTNPGGFKGMGEGGAIGSHAAVANAVADALAHLGVHVTETPLGPRDIERLLSSVPHSPC